jgi:DNA-binding IclR family transcriptional regulator
MAHPQSLGHDTAIGDAADMSAHQRLLLTFLGNEEVWGLGELADATMLVRRDVGRTMASVCRHGWAVSTGEHTWAITEFGKQILGLRSDVDANKRRFRTTH